MRSLRAFLLATALAAGALVVATPVHAAPTTYYVNCGAAASGDGSQTAPWNSLSAVNAHTFVPGDAILLARGSTCTGQQLAPRGSGSPGLPIKIDTYGTGSKPLLAGNGRVTDVVLLSNQQYWEIRNLDISNHGATSATRRGVHITRTDSGTGTHYVVEGLNIHDINGDQAKKDADASAGIFFEVLGNTTRTNFDDVLIQNNSISTVDRYGIHFWTGWELRSQLANPSCGNVCGAWDPQTHVVIRSNTVTDIGGDAVDLHHTQGALAEYNRVDGFRMREPQHCAAGLWGWNTQDDVYQFNEVSGGRSTCDGQGLDLDEANIGTIYQYNYSHDNEGGFILLCNGGGSTTDRSIVRYNISQNDQGQLFDFVCDKITNTAIYNNTFYLNKPVQIINNANGSGAANAVFSNNIFYVATAQASYVTPGSLPFDSNVFYGQHPSGEPYDAHKITADPALAAPGTGTSRTTLDGYKLQSGSSALGKGRVMPGNGGKDYWGNPVPSVCAPDIGANQRSTPNDANCSSATLVISLRAHANGRYVTAENAGASALIANRTAIGSWEQFDEIDEGNGNIALRAHANNMYVCADNAGSSPLIANRTAVGTWEMFNLIHNSDGSVSLRSLANNQIVTADNAGT